MDVGLEQIPSRTSTLSGVARITPARRLVVLVVIALTLRIVFASSLGLGMDEAYTVATSRDYVLSAFDHPPFSWWLAKIGADFFGHDDLGLRLPFVLLSALTNVMIFLLGRRLFGAEAGFWASFALCCAPVLGVIDASWVLPDAPLLPALLGGAWALAHVFFDEDKTRASMWWLVAGLFAGLALLCKYHGVFLLAGAGLFMLCSPRQRFWLASPWPWLAAALALAVFSPVLVWNARHEWASFVFQGGRTGEARFNPAAPFILIGMQSLFLAPWVYFPTAALFFRALWRWRTEPKDFFLACLAAGPIVLFTLPALWSDHRLLPHWAAPGYLLILPILGREIAALLARDTRWMRRVLAGAGGFVVAGIVLLAVLPQFAPPSLRGARYPLLETLDWRDFPREFFSRDLGRPGDFIGASRWFEAGKLDTALGGAYPVLCLSDDPRGFGATRDPRIYVGHDALLVARHMTLEQAYQLYEDFFDAIEPLAPITINAGGAPAFDLQVFRGRNFHDPAPEFTLGIGARALKPSTGLGLVQDRA